MDTFKLALCHMGKQSGWRRREAGLFSTTPCEGVVDRCITYTAMGARFQVIRNFGRLESLIVDRGGMFQRGINLSIDVERHTTLGAC